MSVNYTISDVFNYEFTGTTSTTALSTNASTGLLYRDAANADEVRVLLASAVTGQVLTTTGANTVAWDTPAAGNVTTGTEFIVRPTAAQTVTTGALGTFVDVVFGTEILDAGADFATNFYTIPSTGTYVFHFALEWSTVNKTNAGSRQVNLRNDTAVTNLLTLTEQPNPNNGIAFWQRGSVVVSATASDVIKLQAIHDAGTNQDIGTGTRWSGHRIG